MPNSNFELKLPDHTQRLLLHSCCAPCSASIIERLVYSEIDVTVYFYNPNIQPQKEYLLRKEQNIQFAEKLGVTFIDGDYDAKAWLKRTKALANEPERGQRCKICFDIRLEQTARFAHQHHFELFSSSLGISRWKNLEQIHASGQEAASHYPDLQYWSFNWRKKGGSQRMIELAKQEHFYQQQYCGCVYSLRDTNQWRQTKGLDLIDIGTDHYS